jgi:hypothetical protein
MLGVSFFFAGYETYANATYDNDMIGWIADL